MRILPCGERALLLEFPTLEAVLLAAAAVRERRSGGVPPWDRVVDVVAAARTLLVSAAAVEGLRPALQELVAAAEAAPRPVPTTVRTVPVRYDGEDLTEVSRLTGLTVAEVVAAHTGTDWQVAFSGFAPGFAYLVGGDPRLRVPRHAEPRTRVPAGAVGLADGFSGVYPRASPGGWQLIGSTDLTLFDPTADSPALLAPGDTVRFVVAEGAAEPAVPAAAAHPLSPRRRLVVEACLFPILSQDAGRPGMADLGIGASGAADRGAYRLGNRLVGNPAGAAVLEITAGSVALRAVGALTAALTGAVCPAEVGGRAVSPGVAFTIGDGETLRLGAPGVGLRTYLAVRGGIDLPPVLGSRSLDVLGGLGPEPLTVGDPVPVGEAAPGWWPEVDWAPLDAAAAPVVELAYLPGPRADWVSGLAGSLWTVTPATDRVGARLTGTPLGRREGELPSEPVVRGALQVPPSGEPVIFLADHPVTGGYPVAGVLTERAADRAAQLRPGQRCALVPARGSGGESTAPG